MNCSSLVKFVSKAIKELILSYVLPLLDVISQSRDPTLSGASIKCRDRKYSCGFGGVNPIADAVGMAIRLGIDDPFSL
jgi:hypothetical protein